MAADAASTGHTELSVDINVKRDLTTVINTTPAPGVRGLLCNDCRGCRVHPRRGEALCPAADPFALADANINPVTGLSTDYLNHFNEAVMLLEMIPSMPECRGDLMAWQPATCREHFAGSHLTQRALALAAYDLADRLTRRQFDELCAAMTTTVVAVREALTADISAAATAAITKQAAAWLKPLIARTSAVIHGLDISRGETLSIQDSQAAVDALLEP